jgi:hypothetical protein
MRTHKAHLVAHIAIAFSILFLSGQGTAADASLKDDAYHYLHNGIDDQLYNEWWYFNGISSDTQFSISYFLSDPENLTGLRRFQVRAIVLEEGKPPVVGLHQSRGFGGDKNGPNVDIDQSGLSYEDESNFKLWGTVFDISSGAPIKWDLAYESAAAPWFATPVQAHVGHTKGDWMKWLVYMPSARVTGTLSWDGQTKEIEAVGYHDHSWGRWVFNDPQCGWAQVAVPEDGFAMVLGDAIGEQRNTILGISYAGEELKFSGKKVEMNYTDFSLDQLTSRTYPVAYEIKADNGDYELEANVSVIKNVPLLISYPAPLPSYVIFEQVALFSGTLRSQEGEVYQFEEMGFAQYTTHRLHPIFGRVNAKDAENNDITIAAVDERTGQTKTAEPSSEGWFSFDASYADYLADSAAPWVADGDAVKVEVRDAAGRQNSSAITIDLTEGAQDAGIIELSRYF